MLVIIALRKAVYLSITRVHMGIPIVRILLSEMQVASLKQERGQAKVSLGLSFERASLSRSMVLQASGIK